MSRTCFQLGVCQARKPRCVDCEGPRLLLAPGVIDGPYRHQTTVDRAQREALRSVQAAKDALRMVAAYLMGPHP